MVSERDRSIRRLVSRSAIMLEDYIENNKSTISSTNFDMMSRMACCLHSLAAEVFNGLTEPDCDCICCNSIPQNCSTKDYTKLMLNRTVESLSLLIRGNDRTYDMKARAFVSNVIVDLKLLHDAIKFDVSLPALS